MNLQKLHSIISENPLCFSRNQNGGEWGMGTKIDIIDDKFKKNIDHDQYFFKK